MNQNRINPGGYRPPYYPSSCKGQQPVPAADSCQCSQSPQWKKPDCKGDDPMVLAMGYVPFQPQYHHLFHPSQGLREGTMFPELCKPFCGKRGGRGC